MKSRTSREFTYNGDFWTLVDEWAAETGFKVREQEGDWRLFQRGIPLTMAPSMVEIRKRKAKVTVEAWVKADPYLILAFLTGRSSEMGIESGGLTALFPRKRTRDAVNILLRRLGEPPVR